MIELDANTGAVVGWNGHQGYEVIHRNWRLSEREAIQIAESYDWSDGVKAKVTKAIRCFVAQRDELHPARLRAGYRFEFEEFDAELEINAETGKVAMYEISKQQVVRNRIQATGIQPLRR
jgi:hypothetical protein